jgi:hypothetical protein
MLSAVIMALAMQTTTTCIPMGGQVTCTSNTPAAVQTTPYQPIQITPVDVAGAYRAAQAGRAAREQVDEADVTPKSGATVVNSFQEELANRMGILSRQNRCEDAFRLAALAGESELADASRSLCPF